jgi:hypothetical protein
VRVPTLSSLQVARSPQASNGTLSWAPLTGPSPTSHGMRTAGLALQITACANHCCPFGGAFQLRISLQQLNLSTMSAPSWPAAARRLRVRARLAATAHT